jgi:hypothetical protein
MAISESTIKKQVETINALITKANKLGINVIDESVTWQAPLKYNIIKFVKGKIYISYSQLDLYAYHRKGVKIWKKESFVTGTKGYGSNDIFYGNPLPDIKRMYTKALKYH